ncbi:hypothetical protein LY78DRAFT_129315 [Colletotrichum sublineola]|nr:hypothetical protein LY78DRAFT_129315 [Colletotrichum sublineola]
MSTLPCLRRCREPVARTKRVSRCLMRKKPANGKEKGSSCLRVYVCTCCVHVWKVGRRTVREVPDSLCYLFFGGGKESVRCPPPAPPPKVIARKVLPAAPHTLGQARYFSLTLSRSTFSSPTPTPIFFSCGLRRPPSYLSITFPSFWFLPPCPYRKSSHLLLSPFRAARTKGIPTRGPVNPILVPFSPFACLLLPHLPLRSCYFIFFCCALHFARHLS